MADTNKIYCCDALEGLSKLENESVDLIITSPPYNLTGFNGRHKRNSSDIWHKNILYDCDNTEEGQYEHWQIRILDECFRVLKNDGSMFYNHKVRVKRNQISHPIEWISKSDFRCRQIITWDRTSSPNVHTCRYIPTTELIFWLCKTDRNPRFKRDSNAIFQTDVWRFPAEKNTEHPAPFPLAIPDNIIPSVAQGERIVVLDPFMGSGTVAISAINNGCDYIGFEIDKSYVEMAQNRIKENKLV